MQLATNEPAQAHAETNFIASRISAPQHMLWILRGVLLIQCAGVCTAFLYAAMEQESDIFEILYFNWDWPEHIAQRLEDYGTIAYGLGAIVAVLIPLADRMFNNAANVRWTSAIQVLLLTYIAIWQLLVALTVTLRGSTFMSEWAWAEQMVRWVCPLGIIALLPYRDRRTISRRRYQMADRLLRGAAAITFIIHGWKAILRAPAFITLLVGTFPQLSQLTAETALWCIGIVDFAVATLLLATRLRSVAYWMVFWGLLTALSRATALGLPALPDVAYRAANWGVPLAVVIGWHYCSDRYRQSRGEQDLRTSE